MVQRHFSGLDGDGVVAHPPAQHVAGGGVALPFARSVRLFPPVGHFADDPRGVDGSAPAFDEVSRRRGGVLGVSVVVADEESFGTCRAGKRTVR